VGWGGTGRCGDCEHTADRQPSLNHEAEQVASSKKDFLTSRIFRQEYHHKHKKNHPEKESQGRSTNFIKATQCTSSEEDRGGCVSCQTIIRFFFEKVWGGGGGGGGVVSSYISQQTPQNIVKREIIATL